MNGAGEVSLKFEHRVVLETVEAINLETGTPASAKEVLAVLPDHERKALEETYQSALPRAVAKILANLQGRGLLSSIKSGRSRLYFLSGMVPPETCAELAKPSRRRRVLELVRRVVAAVRRAVRAQEVVDHAEFEGLTSEISGDMIKRDLTNLVRTGELTVVDTVRGDGGGSNLYLPSDLDPTEYLPDGPLTWLEELKTTFDAVWGDRVAEAQAEGRTPVPPSTGDIRERFRAKYPDHPKLSDPQLLVNGIRQLADTSSAHVRPVRREGERALLWAPIDVTDDDLDLGAAHTSDSERLGQAVERALAALNVPTVTIRDVTDQIELDEILRPAGRQPIHQLLSDVARDTLHNPDGTKSERVHQRVVRAGTVEGIVHYTTPGMEGVDAYLEMLRLRAEWPGLCAKERLDSLVRCALPGVVVGRARLIAAECREITRRAEAIAGDLTFPAWSDEVSSIAAQADACAGEASSVFVEMEVAGPVEPPVQICSGFTAQQLGALIIPRYPLAGVEATPSRLVPLLAPRIRRVVNPEHVRRFSTDPSAAAEYLFERVEALTYAAFRWGDGDEKYYANLAVTTLGRLRDYRFVVPTLQSDRFEERQVAVACLAFLGDPARHLSRVAEDDPDVIVRSAAEWGVAYARSVAEATK